MALRKATAYSKKRVRPYTRKSGIRTFAYIKTIPQNKIVKFSMGDVNGFNSGKHSYAVKLISTERVQVRDNALESCRMHVHKALEKKIPGNYYFVIKVYPHHILRENKTAAGAAGADRLSSGMKHSFGVTIGRAAIVGSGKEILFISTPDEKTARLAYECLEKAKAKIPCASKIVFEKFTKK